MKIILFSLLWGEQKIKKEKSKFIGGFQMTFLTLEERIEEVRKILKDTKMIPYLKDKYPDKLKELDDCSTDRELDRYIDWYTSDEVYNGFLKWYKSERLIKRAMTSKNQRDPIKVDA